MSPASRPWLARGVRLRTDATRGEALLLAPERGLVLTATAAAVLALCTGAHTVDAIVAALAARYAAPAAVVARDVAALLDALERRGLVVEVA